MSLQCPSCESSSHKFLFKIETDSIIECCDCGLVFADSPVEDLFALYQEKYYEGLGHGGYDNYEKEWRSHLSTFQSRLREAEDRLGHSGIMLDYGCALGHLGHSAQQRGWKVVATDISYYAVERAVKNYGLIGFVSDMSAPPLRPGLFDLVTVHDVIEHVRKPKEILHALQPLVHDKGLIHFTTPDIGSWSAKLLGRWWYHFKAKEHLIYFDKTSLKKMLNACDFRVIHCAPVPSYMSLDNILVRLRRYSTRLANFALFILRLFGWNEFIMKIFVGEMQAWVKPSKNISPRPLLSSPNSLSLLDVICCPACQGQLIGSLKNSKLNCQSCHQEYPVKNGIPILIPNREMLRTAANQ